MKALSLLLFQLDHSAQLISDGRQEHLRVALLLLDNSAELQMEWAIRGAFRSSALEEKLRSLALMIPAAQRPKDLESLVEWQPLTVREKRKVTRYFDERVSFLAASDRIPNALVLPLRHLHRYRNEAYHSGRIRARTLLLSCQLYLEINFQLAVSLPTVASAYSSTEDYSWLRGRFGPGKGPLCSDSYLLEVIRDLRAETEGLALVPRTLAAHLLARVSDLRESLQFCVDASEWFSTPEQVLRESLYYSTLALPDRRGFQEPPPTFQAPYDLSTLETLETEAAAVSRIEEPLSAFTAYSRLESTLESIEEPVKSTELQVDAAVQAAVDLSLGK